MVGCDEFLPSDVYVCAFVIGSINFIINQLVRNSGILRVFYFQNVSQSSHNPLIWNASSLLRNAGISCTVLSPCVSCATMLPLYTRSFHLYEQFVFDRNVLSLLRVTMALVTLLFNSLSLLALLPPRCMAWPTSDIGFSPLKWMCAFPFIAT